jgi:hypothetical protein
MESALGDVICSRSAFTKNDYCPERLNARKLNYASKFSCQGSSTTDINATKQEKLVEHTPSSEGFENVKLGINLE